METFSNETLGEKQPVLDNEEIETLLRNLGGSRKLAGFSYAAYMVGLVQREPSYLRAISAKLYQETARVFHVTGYSVERNLRTFVHICWERGDQQLWEQVAGRKLDRSPTNGEFIDIIAAYLR